MKFLKVGLGILFFLAVTFLTRPGQNFVLGVGIACTLDGWETCQPIVDYAVKDLKKGNLF